jgi:nucleoside phosphorylase
MADQETSLEGWVPELGHGVSLARIIDLAFDYRGNTTVVKRDGSEVVGYLFNRNADVATPFIQMFDAGGAGPFKIPYSEIATIKFSGKDTAAGNSYAAWTRHKEAERARLPTGVERRRLLVLTALEWEARELARRLRLRRVASTPWPHFSSASSRSDGRAGEPREGGLEVMPVGLRAGLLASRWYAGGPQPDLIVSAGLCGALSPALAVGDLLMPTVVLTTGGDSPPVPSMTAGGDSFQVDVRAHADALAAAARAGAAPQTDPIVTATSIVATPEAKRRLGLDTGAAGVDLESAAILRAARDRGVAALVIRAVSDIAGQTLAAELVRVADTAGRVRPAAAMLALRRPSLIPEALALRRGTRRALERVAAVLRHLECPTR